MQPPVPQLPPTPTSPRRRHAGARIIQKGGGGGGGGGTANQHVNRQPCRSAFPLTLQPSWGAEKMPRPCSQHLHARPLPAYIYIYLYLYLSPPKLINYLNFKERSHTANWAVGRWAVWWVCVCVWGGGGWRGAGEKPTHTTAASSIYLSGTRVHTVFGSASPD